MRIRYALVIGIVLACADPAAPLIPRDVLVGTWSSPKGVGWRLQLTATANGADLRSPCTTAHFPPLRLDDSMAFQARGVVTAAGGLVPVGVGDSTTIAGRVVGLWVIVGAFTLAPGGNAASVCNA